MMNERYGDPRKILAAYRKEIKDWLIVKAGAAGGFRPCYGCLSFISKVHNAKICKNRRSCKKCQEKHLTSLHGLKIEKKTASRDKTNNENNIGTNNTLVQEGDESGEMLSCNSIYITSDVVSMCVLPV